MPRIVIDNREVDVPAGSTLLDAARQIGLDIPALCWHKGCRPKHELHGVRGEDRARQLQCGVRQ